MNLAEFDQFADEYYNMHAANVAITGERPEFFAEYKIRALRQDTRKLDGSVRRILDFGSGTGNSIPFFRVHHPDADLICADVSRRSLDIAQARFPAQMQELLIEGDGLAVADGSFDVAFSACVFHHIPHAEHLLWLRELRRVVRPGGMIAIFEHNPLNPLTVRAVDTCPFDANARLIRAAGLKRLLDAAGWRFATARYHVFFPRPLARLRPLERLMSWLPLGAQYSVVARK